MPRIDIDWFPTSSKEAKRRKSGGREDGFTLLLINMQRLKHVPGRKTDVQDSAWLAQLLECGLLAASFVLYAAVLLELSGRAPGA